MHVWITMTDWYSGDFLCSMILDWDPEKETQIQLYERAGELALENGISGSIRASGATGKPEAWQQLVDHFGLNKLISMQDMAAAPESLGGFSDSHGRSVHDALKAFN